jgi:plastocyanin domain-containing protein
MFSALNTSKNLVLNAPTDLTLTFDSPGEYEFTCQMAMYRGKVIVHELTQVSQDK